MFSDTFSIYLFNVLKRKREIEEAYERNEPSSKRRVMYSGANNDLNDLVWQWFSCACSQNLPVSGPMIQEMSMVCTSYGINQQRSTQKLLIFLYMYQAYICFFMCCSYDTWKKIIH